MNTKQLILLGPPGVEVEAQAALLAERWQVPHISLAAICRREMEQGSAIGADIRLYLDADGCVPDAVVMKLIRKRLEQPDVILKGWVLDGFPRTQAQAQAFDQWWSGFGKPAATVVYLKAMTGILMNRLSAEQGAGESTAAIRRRLDAYQEAVTPVLEHYQQRSQLKTINASLPFAEVASALTQLGHEETGAARLLKDEAELDALLAQESRLVVDCMAPWCGSCKQVTPLIDRLAAAYRDSVTVTKIDFDVNRQMTKRFGLKGIPAVMFFKDGELLETLIGVKAYSEYSAATARLLA